jgi:hypothetical protein
MKVSGFEHVPTHYGKSVDGEQGMIPPSQLVYAYISCLSLSKAGSNDEVSSLLIVIFEPYPSLSNLPKRSLI